MKAILMSIKPKYVSMILNNIKTIEVRKRFPKDYVGWVYIYCTKGKTTTINLETLLFDNPQNAIRNGKVVARFWCDKVDYYEDVCFWNEENEKASCVTASEFFDYMHHIKCHRSCCLIHITKLEIFDKPKEISEFMKVSCKGCPFENTQTCHNNTDGRYCKLNRAPQSWCYVEV